MAEMFSIFIGFRYLLFVRKKQGEMHGTLRKNILKFAENILSLKYFAGLTQLPVIEFIVHPYTCWSSFPKAIKQTQFCTVGSICGVFF